MKFFWNTGWSPYFKVTTIIAYAALSFTLGLYTAMGFASCVSDKEVISATPDIIVKAHVETQSDVIIADVGSGIVKITKSGTLTYLKGNDLDNDFIEVQTLPSPQALGVRSYIYAGNKAVVYDPLKETLTFVGGLPAKEDDRYNE